MARDDAAKQDKRYDQAVGVALGRVFMGVFVGCLEGDNMTREEALEVVKAYAQQLAAQSGIQLETEDDPDDA